MGILYGFDKPREKSPTSKKLDELFEQFDNGALLPDMAELFSALASTRSNTLEIKDHRVELYIGDLLTTANRIIDRAGYIPSCQRVSHDVILCLKKRNGGEKLIKLDLDSRIIIQNSN